MNDTTTHRSLRDLTKGIRVAMLTTEASSGLESRPLTVQRTDDNVVWFLVVANADWLPTSTVRGNLAYVDDKVWVSVSGSVEVSRDPAVLEDLGDPISDTWFQDGQTPLALRFQVSHGEWWESPGMVSAAVNVAKAKLTDDQPDVGSHGTVG